MTPGSFSKSDSVHQKQPLAKTALAGCAKAGRAAARTTAARSVNRFMGDRTGMAGAMFPERRRPRRRSVEGWRRDAATPAGGDAGAPHAFMFPRARPSTEQTVEIVQLIRDI